MMKFLAPYIKNEQKVSKDKSIQEKIKKIEKQEKLLPGTIPSIKAMIVEFIFDCEKKGVKQVALQVALQDIYQALEERIKKKSGETDTKAILLETLSGANSTTMC